MLNYAHDPAVDSEPAKAVEYQPPETPKAAHNLRGLRRYCVDPLNRSTNLPIYQFTDLPRRIPRPQRAGDIEQPVAQVAQCELIGLAAGDGAGGPVAAAVAG